MRKIKHSMADRSNLPDTRKKLLSKIKFYTHIIKQIRHNSNSYNYNKMIIAGYVGRKKSTQNSNVATFNFVLSN